MNNIVLLILLVFIHDVCSIVNVNLIFPKYVIEGESTTLICSYDLQGEQLYALKWYRGNYEFYRFQPKENPKIKIFSLPGLTVDLNSSSSNRVTLLNVPRHLRGNYTCEVSGEEPTYTTKQVTEYLEIIPGNESNHLANLELNSNEHQPDNLIECAPENKSNIVYSSGIMLIILVTMRRLILINYL